MSDNRKAEVSERYRTYAEPMPLLIERYQRGIIEWRHRIIIWYQNHMSCGRETIPSSHGMFTINSILASGEYQTTGSRALYKAKGRF
jgi:hypothetical protein